MGKSAQCGAVARKVSSVKATGAAMLARPEHLRINCRARLFFNAGHYGSKLVSILAKTSQFLPSVGPEENCSVEC